MNLLRGTCVKLQSVKLQSVRLQSVGSLRFSFSSYGPTPQQIEHMKRLLNQGGEVNEGENFFKKQEQRLSLRLLQISTASELLAQIKQYEKEQDGEIGTLTRCRMLIIHKHLGMDNKLTDQVIARIREQVFEHVHQLDEDCLKELLKIISHSKVTLPQLPLIKEVSHRSSSILALLLMLYPSQKLPIITHYNLIFDDYLYDPQNLVYLMINTEGAFAEQMMAHLDRAMQTNDLEECTSGVESIFINNLKLKERQERALIYSCLNRRGDILERYFVVSSTHFSLDCYVDILMAVQEGFPENTLINTANRCLKGIELRVREDQGEERELSRQYVNVAGSISLLLGTSFMGQLIYLPSVINTYFERSWGVDLEGLTIEKLNAVIACLYCYKIIRKEQLVEHEKAMLAAAITVYRAKVEDGELGDHPAQLGYLLLVLKQFEMLPYLKSDGVIQEIFRLERNGYPNQKMEIAIKSILKDWNAGK